MLKTMLISFTSSLIFSLIVNIKCFLKTTRKHNIDSLVSIINSNAKQYNIEYIKCIDCKNIKYKLFSKDIEHLEININVNESQFIADKLMNNNFDKFFEDIKTIISLEFLFHIKQCIISVRSEVNDSVY